MATFLSDAFNDADGTSILAHTGEIGATWARNGNYPGGSASITDANRLRATVGIAVFYGSGVPESADYTMTAPVRLAGTADGYVGVVGRSATATGDFYWAIYSVAGGGWQLWKIVGGSITQLGSTYTQALTAGVTYTLALDMAGTTIRLLVDGVQRVSVTDSSHTAAGKGGVLLYSPGGASNANGLHIESIEGATANSSALGGNVTADPAVAAGTFTTSASDLGGNVTADAAVAAGSMGSQPGTVTSEPLRDKFTGALLAGVTIPKIAFVRVSDMAAVLTVVDALTNGAGRLVTSNAALVAGTKYLVVTCNSDGSAYGAEVYTAT